jgi:hypothetical protein
MQNNSLIMSTKKYHMKMNILDIFISYLHFFLYKLICSYTFYFMHYLVLVKMNFFWYWYNSLYNQTFTNPFYLIAFTFTLMCILLFNRYKYLHRLSKRIHIKVKVKAWDKMGLWRFCYTSCCINTKKNSF